MRKIIAVCAAVLAGEVRADDVRYEYNGRSGLVRVSCGDETLFGYEYDLAGNLRWASIGSSTNVYETNGLNQYTRVAASNGQVCHLAYDEDGNLIEDARYMYNWDSACRMTEALPSSLQGGLAVKNYYDALGRRVKKEVRLIAPPNGYPRERLLTTTTFVYDGKRIVREDIKDLVGRTFCTEYYWGKDLSGTLDGAGGVGGLILVRVDGVCYVPICDAGGNISVYCNAQGTVVAERAYSPFGQMISARSSNELLFRRLHIWFSTKYLDLETGLYDFGGRFYSPFLCRWLNRDPLGERGGLNLYAFCRNDPVNNYDKDGCAYFAYRVLDSNLAKPFGIVQTDYLERKNWVVAHEQLYFEDGGEPHDIGYFKLDGNGGTGQDALFYANKHVEKKGRYDDCVMREAVKNVQPKPYRLAGSNGMQYNCQDYADDLRKEYFRLLADKNIWCKCGLNKKGKR